MTGYLERELKLLVLPICLTSISSSVAQNSSLTQGFEQCRSAASPDPENRILQRRRQDRAPPECCTRFRDEEVRLAAIRRTRELGSATSFRITTG